MIREKIKNKLKITCDDVDLTTVTDIEFYIRQLNFFGCYTPLVLSENTMVVTIPFVDAKKLRHGKAELQFAFTDAEGNARATDIVIKEVGDLLKESGYDPI
jgi:hypothetical protein